MALTANQPRTSDEAEQIETAATASAREALLGTLDPKPPTGRQINAQNVIVDDFIKAFADITLMIAPSRRRALALTKLEEAKMFAVAAIYEEN